jgi:hypothetical protein
VLEAAAGVELDGATVFFELLGALELAGFSGAVMLLDGLIEELSLAGL